MSVFSGTPGNLAAFVRVAYLLGQTAVVAGRRDT